MLAQLDLRHVLEIDMYNNCILIKACDLLSWNLQSVVNIKKSTWLTVKDLSNGMQQDHIKLKYVSQAQVHWFWGSHIVNFITFLINGIPCALLLSIALSQNTDKFQFCFHFLHSRHAQGSLPMIWLQHETKPCLVSFDKILWRSKMYFTMDYDRRILRVFFLTFGT